MAFCRCPQLAIPLKISGFLKCHGYEFRFKKEKNLLNRKGKIAFTIFASVKYMMELIFMWMSMQGIKFRDFMSIFVGTSNRNGSRTIPKRTRARIIVLRLNLCQCQSVCNVVMVI